MSEPPWDRILRDRSERVVRHWPAESARADGEADRSGWLILTDRRLLFVRRGGWRARAQDAESPDVTLPLESIRQIEARPFQMRIGYGDRVVIPGIAIDGHAFRLPRETPAEEVRFVLEQAARSRRSGSDRSPT